MPNDFPTLADPASTSPSVPSPCHRLAPALASRTNRLPRPTQLRPLTSRSSSRPTSPSSPDQTHSDYPSHRCPYLIDHPTHACNQYRRAASGPPSSRSTAQAMPCSPAPTNRPHSTAQATPSLFRLTVHMRLSDPVLHCPPLSTGPPNPCLSRQPLPVLSWPPSDHPTQHTPLLSD